MIAAFKEFHAKNEKNQHLLKHYEDNLPVYTFTNDYEFNPDRYSNECLSKKLYVIVPVFKYNLLVNIDNIHNDGKLSFNIKGLSKYGQISTDTVKLADIILNRHKIIYYEQLVELRVYDENVKFNICVHQFIPDFKIIKYICIEVLKYFFMQRIMNAESMLGTFEGPIIKIDQNLFK